MVQVCRCDRCLDQTVSGKLLCKKYFPDDIFKNIDAYNRCLGCDGRARAVKFKTIMGKISPYAFPHSVSIAKRQVKDRTLTKYLNCSSFAYLSLVVGCLKYLNNNDIKDFRRSVYYRDIADRIYTNMKIKYKKPFPIQLEELAIRFFSDYFKRELSNNEEVEYMVKMLKQIFL